ncbi:hypothetical protein [Clostridium estertheticum]|uniref:Late control protein D n=1 Tax=Clostridium estertheticum subsp. estertheticum TaxID=1552 RepID=A0A1J0GG53_9CLOT|nr:hypothetical protein [Clostridium estertheticum]APC40346.1 hypothetical protein A7L45_09850 [Clostridium estertheticum subsp. estertheticum]
MGAVHTLRVKSPYQLLNIENIKIENKPNEHGYLYLKCLIDDSINFQSTINASTDDKICVYEELEDENSNNKSKIIFNGIVQNIRTSNINGNYYLEIQALTSSFELDVKEKSRSFQDVNMTYDKLIGIIIKDYPGYSYEQCIGEGEKIGKPLFQYKETDWSFLKRISSELKSELSCDIIETLNMFYFGRPSKTSYKLEDTSDYKACKDLKQYHESGGSEAGHDTDYFYYEIETREKYEVGANISFKNKDFYVNQYKARALSDEVIYKYRLCRKNGVWQTKVTNSLIGGASIEGKVLEVKGEKIKLHLNIDKSQNKDKASWLPYAPPTGNVMYSMPIVGTSASLYFPSETSEEPIVTGCVRKNGSSCAKTADTTKRYFGTEHGSEIEMVPGALNIKGGSKVPLSISFDDAVGVTIKSHKKLSLNAAGGITMKTPQSVKLKAQSQILVAKSGTKSGFSMETDLHFLSNNVIKNGSDREAFAAFDDEPTIGKKPEPKPVKKAVVAKPPEKENKGFSWGKLFKAAVAVVAVVAVVALVVVSVATFGAGAVIGAALIGAALGAACNVGGTIASDIKNNKMSSPLDYLISAAKGALVGALCGAMFGPAMAGTSLFAAETTGQLALNFVKTLFIGGAENSTYYALNELANFRMPNLGEQLNQFKNGVLFTGLFTGGAKALETAVSWIKKGASKVMDNIEKNVNKFGKYIDDLVPAKAVTPDGQIVYVKNDPMKSGGGGKKVELNKQQKDYNKAVEESKNGNKTVGKVKKYTPAEFKGTVKVGGEVKDVSRRVYQSNEIDWSIKGDDGLTNLERANLEVHRLMLMEIHLNYTT